MRQWPNIKAMLVQRPMFGGVSCFCLPCLTEPGAGDAQAFGIPREPPVKPVRTLWGRPGSSMSVLPHVDQVVSMNTWEDKSVIDHFTNKLLGISSNIYIYLQSCLLHIFVSSICVNISWLFIGQKKSEKYAFDLWILKWSHYTFLRPKKFLQKSYWQHWATKDGWLFCHS